MTSINSSAPRFCGTCGNRFITGQFTATSKFCEFCGNELSAAVLQYISNTFNLSTSPITPARKQQGDVETTDGDVETPTRQTQNVGGCGIGRPRGGYGRGLVATPVVYQPTTPPASTQPELRRELRTTGRPNYSLKDYYKGASGKSTPNKTRNEAFGSPFKKQRTATPIDENLDQIIVEPIRGPVDLGLSPVSVEHQVPEDLQRELDSPVQEYRPANLARRSRPFSIARGGNRSTTSPRAEISDETLPEGDVFAHSPVSQLSEISEPSPPFISEEEPVPLESTGEVIQHLDLEEDKFALAVGNVIMPSAFDLGSPVHVPAKYHGLVQNPRGNHQNHTMLRVRRTFHEYSPQRPGEHGILYLDRNDLPKNLNKQRFNMMEINDRGIYRAGRWQYLGIYQIVHKFHMTVTQWCHVREPVRSKKCQKWFITGIAKKWAAANNIDLENFRDAVDQGRWRFDCLVIKCIGFDSTLYQALANKVEEPVAPETTEAIDWDGVLGDV